MLSKKLKKLDISLNDFFFVKLKISIQTIVVKKIKIENKIK